MKKLESIVSGKEEIIIEKETQIQLKSIIKEIEATKLTLE
jgi:hypothetical protein